MLKDLPNDAGQCPICLEELNQVVYLNCQHKYCKACITQWYRTSNLPTCPNCLKPFLLTDFKSADGSKNNYEIKYKLDENTKIMLDTLKAAQSYIENFCSSLTDHVVELEQLICLTNFLRQNFLLTTDKEYETNGPLILKTNNLYKKLVDNLRNIRKVQDDSYSLQIEIMNNCKHLFDPLPYVFHDEDSVVHNLEYYLEEIISDKYSLTEALDVKYKRGKYKSDRFFKLFAYILKNGKFSFGTCPQAYDGSPFRVWADKLTEFLDSIQPSSDHISIELLKFLMPNKATFWNAKSFKEGMDELISELEIVLD